MTAAKYEGTRQGTATLDGTGAATIELDPNPAWDQWTVTLVNVKTTTPAGAAPSVVPTAEVYLNDASIFANHHGGTRDGDLDVARGRIIVDAGDTLLVVFTGGNPGDHAFASAWGTYERTRAWPGA